eukprot:2623180-Pyramimonas_sp.AAC.1
MSKALYTELQTWFGNSCFEMQDRAKASNIMTSRYVCTCKLVKNEKGETERTIRLRLVLRGFMDLEAFDVETFSGTARRPSQRRLASTAACKKQWAIASHQELAGAIGETGTRGTFYFAAWIGHGASGPPWIRTLRPVTALFAAPETRHGHQRRTTSFLTKTQKDHPRFWSPTHVLRRGVRDEQQLAYGQTC